MISELQIRDFQAHEKLKIEFKPGVNTIVGASDVGKSAIIRALSWVLFNQPSGDEFIRHGAKQARARVVVDDQAIVRARGKGVNTYALGEEEFAAFGSGVPEEITKLLRVDEINIQRQHDAPFWFALSDGEISRRLNIVINLGIIDRVLGEVAGKVSQTRTKLNLVTEQLAKAKQDKKDLAFAEEMERQLLEVEEASTRFEHAKSDRMALELLVKNLEAQNNTIRDAKASLSRGVDLLGLATLWREARLKRKALHALNITALEWHALAKIKLPDFAEVERARMAADEAAGKTSMLQQLVRRQEQQFEILRRLEVEYKAQSANLKDAMRGRCPLCGQPIPSK